MKKTIGILLFAIAIVLILNLLKSKPEENNEPLPRNDLQDENTYTDPVNNDSIEDIQDYE